MIRSVAVLGAGTMGAGIAQACAQAGLDTRLRDIKQDILDTAVERLRGPLEARVDKGKMSRREVDAIFERLTATTDLEEAVEGVDLVIEAVPEDLDLKRKVFEEVEAAASEEAILATNTSSLRVGDLAEISSRPERFGGLHFFFPAQINKLLEVVAHDGTADEVHRELLDFGQAIGKIVIETDDASGFCVNRFFVPWVNEAVRMLDEGVAEIPTIDAAAREAFGITMGPFKLMNVTGVPISLHAQRSLHGAYGPFYEPAEGLVHQVEEVGEDWDLDGQPDESAFEAVADRLKGVVFAIACHLVQEGVATPVDTDKGAVVGLRWKQGPFAMMNEMGCAAALELVESLHNNWGSDLPLPDNLVRQAERSEAWHLPLVDVSVRERVATLTLQRPAALNALNAALLEDLDAALAEVQEDPAVRAVVLTGEGTTFVSGADIKEMSTKGPWEARDYAKLGQRVTRRIEGGRVPVIAAINGYAFGGGLELALACDLLLVAEEATLGLPETSLGIQPGFGGTQRLPRLVGLQRARELVYTGRRFPGQEAAEMGLALAALPRAELLPEARRLARKIAANAPLAVASAKRTIQQGTQADLDTGLSLELEATALLFGTEDQEEGMAAFAERRRPEFSGR